MQIQIRNNVETYMKELKEWLQSIQDTPIEEMGEFFTKRIGSYEEHMSLWKGAYAFSAGQVPENTEKMFIHFNIPLTLEHEMQLLCRAGFDRAEALASIEGTTVIREKKVRTGRSAGFTAGKI